MKVSIGPSSISGWLTFVGAEAGFAATAISGSEAQLRGPGKWLAILGVVALVATNAGRQLQARSSGEAQPQERPESARRPDAEPV